MYSSKYSAVSESFVTGKHGDAYTSYNKVFNYSDVFSNSLIISKDWRLKDWKDF